MSTYTGSTREQAIIKATMGTCRPCCRGAGSGSGSGGGGIPVPCGCAGCNCCPGICWWATQWHRSWSTTSPRYATGVGTPAYTMTAYTLALISNPDDYYYLGDVASGEDFCEIGGVFPVDGACDPGEPLHILTGIVEWTETAAPFTVYSYTIDYFLDIRLLWSCNSDIVASTFFGFYKDGIQYISGTDPIFDSFATSADFAIAINNNTDEAGLDTSTCGFTLNLSGIYIPDITIIPIA